MSSVQSKLGNSDLEKRAFAEATVLFGVGLVIFRWLIGQWHGVPDFDGHYHLRVVQWMAHVGFWTDIPWLPFTVLGEHGPDHHWLWHVMLLPFAWISDPEQALAWANAFNAALALAVITLVMRQLGVPAAPLFALLAVSAGMLLPYRLLMLRAQNVALIYIMLSVWAMARGRYKTLGALAFLFLESYHAAAILVPLALIGSVARSLAERRIVATPMVAVAAGMALALVVSPWYPRNVEYLLFHILFKAARNPINGEELSALLPQEWYPVPAPYLLLQAWPSHLMLAGAIALLAWRRRCDPAFRAGVDTMIAGAAASLSLLLYFFAIRFAEYYVPLAALTAGLAARDAAPRGGYAWRHAALLCGWLFVAGSVGFSSLQRLPLLPEHYLAAIGARLNELGEPGDVVFNSGWSDFMPLVWWAGGFRYVNGLDGHYLAYGDPARFVVWTAAGLGALEDPATTVRLAFGARFAVVARQHRVLAQQLMHSPHAALRTTSADGWLFELKR